MVELNRRHLLRTGAVAGLGISGVTASVPTRAQSPGEILWSFETERRVHSPATVVNDTVFVGSNDHYLYAINAEDGTEQWRAESNSGVQIAPAVMDGTVYACLSDKMTALDAEDGTKQWTSSNEIHNATPTVANESVYCGDHEKLYALDTQNGAERWSVEPKGSFGFVSPTVVNGTVYVTDNRGSEPADGTHGKVHAIDAETGTFEWTSDIHNDSALGGVTVANSTVYVGRYAFEADNGNEKWRFDDVQSKKKRGVPTVADGTVYFGEKNNALFALDAEDGTEKWRFEGVEYPTISGGPTVVDDTVFIGIDDRLYAIDTSDGTERWSKSIGNRLVLAPPTIVDGTIYVGDDLGKVHAIDAGVTGSSEGSRVMLRTTGHHGKPLANFTVETENPIPGTEIKFDASSSSHPDGEISSYDWDFSNNGSYDTTGMTPKYAFDSAGEFQVSLRVTTSGGETSTVTRTISVEAGSITVSARSLELVQTVSDTYVSSQGVSTEISNPDMVAGRPTAALFRVSGENISSISDDDHIRVTVEQTLSDGSTETETGELSGETLKRLEIGDNASYEVSAERIFQDAASDKRQPVFTLNPDVESITVSFSSIEEGEASTTITSDTRSISAGSDFTITEMNPLKIGFISIKAPQTSFEEFFQATPGKIPEEFDPDEMIYAYGGDTTRDSGGTISADTGDDAWQHLSNQVEEIVDYLERTYPVPSVEYELHPDYLEGNVASSGLVGGVPDGLEQDLRSAYDAVHTEFPETEFDEIVAIVPRRYHYYHYQAAGGVHLSADFSTQPQAACTVEWQGSGSGMKYAASVAAQEIGHHFHGQSAYPDEMAMRTPDDNDGLTIDNSHARTEDRRVFEEGEAVTDEPAVRSRAYDLGDGTFTLLQEGSTEGFWDGYGDDSQWSLGSYMGYSSEEKWADVYIYQQSIDDNLTPTPRVEANESVPLLSGNGLITDEGEIKVGTTTTRQGKPTPTTEDADGVTINVRDSEGNTIETKVVPNSIIIQGHGAGNERLNGHFTFAVPFPEESVEVSVQHDTSDSEAEVETTVNPVERTLTGAINNLPNSAFTSKPDERRRQLLSTVETLNSQMNNKNYSAAIDSLDKLESDIKAWLQDEYETTAEKPTKSDIQSLVENMRSRMNTVEQTDNQGNSSILEDWGPIIGGTSIASLAGAGATYKYLKSGKSGEEDTK
jgi:outer membrane protein assembly factor BamB